MPRRRRRFRPAKPPDPTRLTIVTLTERSLLRIRQYIRNGHAHQADICRMAGITPGALSNVLSGRRPLSPDMADKILSAMGLGILDLLGPEDRRKVVLRDQRISALKLLGRVKKEA
jgi:transcriptional regulator with XRE-family HTH domain